MMTKSPTLQKYDIIYLPLLSDILSTDNPNKNNEILHNTLTIPYNLGDCLCRIPNIDKFLCYFN